MKNLNELKNTYEYRWLNDPYLEIEDCNTYIKINIYDQDQNLVSQILSTVANLNHQKQAIINTLITLRSKPSFSQPLDDYYPALAQAKPIKLNELDKLKSIIKDLINQDQHFGLLELSDFYQLNDQYLMISTQGENENVWKQRYKLKTNLTTAIDCSSDQTILKDLLRHAKKLVAIAQINKYFEFYQSELQKQLPDLLSKPNQSLVKKFYQNSKFATRVNAHDQIIVDHYWNEQLVTSHYWLLNYNLETNKFAITNEVLGMQAFNDTIIKVLDQIKALTNQKPPKQQAKSI